MRAKLPAILYLFEFDLWKISADLFEQSFDTHVQCIFFFFFNQEM